MGPDLYYVGLLAWIHWMHRSLVGGLCTVWLGRMAYGTHPPGIRRGREIASRLVQLVPNVPSIALAGVSGTQSLAAMVEAGSASDTYAQIISLDVL